MSESNPPADTSADLLTLFKSAVDGLYGVRLAFLDKQRANDAAAKLWPSYRLHGDKESLHLVYLVSDEGERLKAIVDEVRDDEDDDAYVEFDVIAPDTQYRLHDDDAAHLVSGGAFEGVTVDEIEAKLFPPVGVAVPDHWNVVGVFPPGVLDHPLNASMMLDQRKLEAANVSTDVRGFYNHIADHKVSKKKEGRGIVGAVLRVDHETGKPRRKIRNVESVGYIGFDFDGGQTLDEAIARLLALRVTFAAYSSYNHLRDGKTHKFRIVIPLKDAFDTSLYANPERANAVWKASYEAFAEVMGFHCDPAAKDITRFFNSPRHPSGGEWFSYIYGGELFELPIVTPEKRPLSKIAKKRAGEGFKIAYDDSGEAYVAEGSGVEFFLSLIGDGEDQLGYHNPIWRTLCSYFATESPDADVEPIVRSIREAIQKADKPTRRAQTDIDRYMSDSYLAEQARNAAEFLRKKREDEEGEEAADDAVAEANDGPTTAPDATTKKPVIYRSDDFDIQCREVRKAIRSRNEPATMLRHGSQLKRIIDSDGRARLKVMSQPNLKTAANESITCFQKRPTKGEKSRKCSIPEDVMSHIWGEDGEWAPEVVRIMPVPILSARGEIHATRGYDAATETYIDWPEDAGLGLPETVTKTHVAESLALVEEAYGEFPFTDDWTGSGVSDGKSSRANFLALLLTPFIRDLYVGPTPFYGVDKPTYGTGAGLLLDVFATIITGAPAATTSLPENDIEFVKVATAKLRQGDPILFFDNVDRKIIGPNIAMLGTSTMWENRILGESEMYRGPVRCVTIFAGNNLKASEENSRRIIPIRMDAHSVDPSKNRTFKHDPLQDWLYENRVKLVGALLTLIKYWVQEGMKPDTSVNMASYTSYVRVVGGILDAVGVTGFLGNRDAFRKVAAQERSDDSAWLQAIYDDRAHVAKALTFTAADGLPSLLDGNEVRFPSLNLDAEDMRGKVRQLGHRLQKVNGRQFILSHDAKTDVEVRVTIKGQEDHTNVYEFVVVRKIEVKPEDVMS